MSFWEDLGDGVVGLLKHPIDEAKWMFDETKGVVKPLLKGDVSESWDSFKGSFGRHNEMMAENITVPLFGENKLSKNPDAVAGAVIGSIMAAPAVMGYFGGGGSGSAIGSSEFASGSFGAKPSFSFNGGVPETGALSGEGLGWQGQAQIGDLSVSPTSGSSFNYGSMGDIMKSVGNALSQIDSGKGSAPGAQRVSFRGAKIPAQQFDAGAIQGAMAAQDFQQQATSGNNLNIPGKKDLNTLLGLA